MRRHFTEADYSQLRHLWRFPVHVYLTPDIRLLFCFSACFYLFIALFSFFKSYSRDYLCQREILGEIPLGKGARLRIRNLLYCIIFLKGLRNFLCHVECLLTLATLKFHVSFLKNLTFFAKWKLFFFMLTRKYLFNTNIVIVLINLTIQL